MVERAITLRCGGRIELGPPLIDLRNAVLRRPRRLQFGGSHLELRPALGILIGTNHLANLKRRNAVSGGSPAALRVHGRVIPQG
jgi:hypothetical protein